MAKPNDLLAVLVDADNVSPAKIGAVLAEVARFGTASVKRVYGDWTKPNLSSWKPIASEHVIQPMQQFANTIGKNATDSALIIDAMDLLYTRRFHGFCIVSSDSDFTRPASAKKASPSMGSESGRHPKRSATRAINSHTSTCSTRLQRRAPRQRSRAFRLRNYAATRSSSPGCG
ncbi:NYN domain-containing protein [Cryobacterium flavum]|uniref:NYN domain-containing protein n=1 Tax=Cryobacterium flavum TaxID=1424659 RepID=A0A5E9G4E6_9MICO|nr:NYN domain-containing protein [Cryobacterium flavum]